MEFFKTRVLEIIKETSDSYSVKMEIPQGYTWTAGQYSVWQFGNHEVEEGDKPARIFTIASAPEDGYLMFTTRISEKHTSWKDIIVNALKVGDEMLVANPKGSFTFHPEYEKSFAVAGGIGITPIRSLVKYFSVNNMAAHEFTVLYSDGRKEYCYHDDFVAFQKEMPNLKLVYVAEIDELNTLMKKYVDENKNTAEYLIAGSPGMNKAVSETLQGFGIEVENIKTDNFIGY